MPTYETPTLISVRFELTQGDVRIEATDRTDTVVVVQPTDPNKRDDLSAAERTTVEFDGGRLSVVAPRTWRRYTPINDGSVDVRIEVPEGSTVEGRADLAALGVSGRVGPCNLRTGMGHIAVDHAGPADLQSGMGDIEIDAVDGALEVKAGSGQVRIGRVSGAIKVKNANGTTDIEGAGGEIAVKSASGSIAIGEAEGDVTAKSAAGAIRIDAVHEGEISAETAIGDIAIGVVAGTAAYLDLSTGYGHVDSNLDDSDEPGDDERRAYVRAHTSAGDVAVRRVHIDPATT